MSHYNKTVFTAAALMALLGGSACGEVDGGEPGPWEQALPYATEVVSFEPGDGAGFGAQGFPDIVLGPPTGRGPMSGSLDVLSLGAGGEIILGFGDEVIVNGDGPDFIVFENAFWAGGDPEAVFAELGEVSVSEDGETWHIFPCEYEAEDPPPYDGCAGWSPTLAFDPEEILPLDPALTGGDAFDLADIGVERARYVRIRDVWGHGEEPSRGFDLDAVGIIVR